MTQLFDECDEIINSDQENNEKLKAICELLKANVQYYDWVGFYIVDKAKRGELVLGPFVGAPTEHTRIKFGSGICGQAAETGKTFLVQDVSRETNYLACSPDVKSEIVVPVFKGDEIVAEIDIDSHTGSAFSAEDREFLEDLSKRLSELFE